MFYLMSGLVFVHGVLLAHLGRSPHLMGKAVRRVRTFNSLSKRLSPLYSMQLYQANTRSERRLARDIRTGNRIRTCEGQYGIQDDLEGSQSGQSKKYMEERRNDDRFISDSLEGDTISVSS